MPGTCFAVSGDPHSSGLCDCSQAQESGLSCSSIGKTCRIVFHFVSWIGNRLLGLSTGILDDIAVFYSHHNWIAVTNRRIFILDDGHIAAGLLGCTDVIADKIVTIKGPC